jgi:hypothetical protein
MRAPHEGYLEDQPFLARLQGYGGAKPGDKTFGLLPRGEVPTARLFIPDPNVEEAFGERPRRRDKIVREMLTAVGLATEATWSLRST